MNRLRNILASLALAVALAAPASARAAQATVPVAAPAATWEEVSSAPTSVTRVIDFEEEMGVAVVDGYIYLWSGKPTTVKLFSILGQLISQETVRPGLHRIRMASRGIFILKAGTLTRRITL